MNKSQFVNAILAARQGLARILDSNCNELVIDGTVSPEDMALIYDLDLQLHSIHTSVTKG